MLQALADLLWMIESPPLLGACPQSEGLVMLSKGPGDLGVEESQLLMEKVKQNPELLEAHLQKRNAQLLGHYFEALIAFFLQQHPGCRLIAANLPVKDNSHTLGEFDYLYWDENKDEAVHLEVAVKFYLCRGRSREWMDWLGPNPRDKMGIKFPKLLEKQARLSDLAEARPLLQKLGINKVRREVLLKGRLYYECNTDSESCEPHYVYSRHLRGGWAHRRPAMGMIKESESLWVELPRLKWLAPAILTPETQTLDGPEMAKRLQKGLRKPLHLAKLDPHSFQETGRTFVVPDGWPSS